MIKCKLCLLYLLYDCLWYVDYRKSCMFVCWFEGFVVFVVFIYYVVLVGLVCELNVLGVEFLVEIV